MIREGSHPNISKKKQERGGIKDIGARCGSLRGKPGQEHLLNLPMSSKGKRKINSYLDSRTRAKDLRPKEGKISRSSL